MPRLREAKTAEEAAKIPVTEPITISLTEGSSEAVVETKAPEPEKVPPVEEDVNPLKKQLEALKQSEELQRQQIAEYQRREQEYQRLVAEQNERAVTSEKAREQSQYNEVVNALAAAQADADKAQTDYAVAMEAQDYNAAAEAQRRMATAAAYMTRYESDKAYLESMRETAKTEPKATSESRQQRPMVTVEQYIDSLPNFSREQREWMKKHPEVVTDQYASNAAAQAHSKASRKKIPVGSDAYFKFMDAELGYEEPAAEDEQSKEGAIVSAPVQRDTPSLSTGKPQTTRVSLTPEQREHARISGIDEVTYAKNLLRMQQMKQNGFYQERN